MALNMSIASILDKIVSKDKDYRYMATSDLLRQLQGENLKMDVSDQLKICAVVLQQLEDTSGDISELAVKCLGLLVGKVSDDRVEELLKRLSANLVDPSKKDHRDITSISLKTVLQEVSTHSNLAPVVAQSLTPKLVKIAKEETDVNVVGETLEVMNLLLSKFGAMTSTHHSALLDCLKPELTASRAGLRKRAIHCVASLAVHLSEADLSALNDFLLAHLRKADGSETTRTYIQTIAAVSRTVGFRYGPFLKEAVPLLVARCVEGDDGETELCECCLQALESFVLRSPQAAKPLLQEIVGTTLKWLSHDPNFDDGMDEDEDYEDEDDSDSEVYSDDEDESWKVRRAAAKCLAAVLGAYPELLDDLYLLVCPKLLERFTEREDNVRQDVLATFIVLLQQVGASQRQSGTALGLLAADAPTVVSQAAAQLKSRGFGGYKVALFCVLKELVSVLPAAIDGAALAALVPGIEHAQEKGAPSALQMESLLFLEALLRAQTDAAAFQPCLQALAQPVLAATAERYYKVAGQALRVVRGLVTVLRPDPKAPVPEALEGVVAPLYDAAAARLSAQDQDQEVKEAAIDCVSRVIAALADVLGDRSSIVLSLLLERLRSETTRLAAVRGFQVIAESPLGVDLKALSRDLLAELTSFLRKADRALRRAALTALTALARASMIAVEPSAAAEVVTEAAAHITDADLHVASLALELCTTVAGQEGSARGAVLEAALPRVLLLVQSPLLQGSALANLLALLRALVEKDPASHAGLLQQLLDAGRSEKARGMAAASGVAACVSAVCVTAGPGAVATTVRDLMAGVRVDGGAVVSGCLALLCIGAIGSKVNLSSIGPVEDTITTALRTGTEELRAAASRALGGITVGAMERYLPFLLREISANQDDHKGQYLRLRSLSQVISAAAFDEELDLSPAEVTQMLGLLLSPGPLVDEECRGVVAECLGHLALSAPELVLPTMETYRTSADAVSRTVVTTGLKYMITDKAHDSDAQLQAVLPAYLGMLQDADRHVRKAAAQTLTVAAHNRPALVTSHLAGCMPALYAATVIDKSLIRIVDLGPFKHKIDDGLELRKAAFECMEVLLTGCADSLDPVPLLGALRSGLGDAADIKLLSHGMLRKLAGRARTVVLSQLETLLPPMEKTMLAKLKADAVKQEVDRHWDMVHSCMRAVDAVARIPEVDACQPWVAFMKKTVASDLLKERYARIQAEHAEAEEASADPMDLS